MRVSDYLVRAELDGHVGLFSGLSGSLSIATADEWRRVEGFLADVDDGIGIESLLERLVETRVLVGDRVDERAELRTRYDRSRAGSATLGYTVVTSLGCNFDCPYCFESKHPSLLKPAVADALVGILEDSLPTINGLSVTWMGGEPLQGARQLLALSDRFIEICDANDIEYRASIVTNGWYLDADMARSLAERRVTSAQVTIDGPPDVHDVKRPHRNGGGTFERIVANLPAAAEHLDVAVRINVDSQNAHRAGELLEILAEAGLAGTINVGVARVTDAVSDTTSPLATYTTPCLSAPDFADYEMSFHALASSMGFGHIGLPGTLGSPCTAVRTSEIVVGADGEMWKCWDDIGNPDQAIGTVFDYTVTNDRLAPWLSYHPLDDEQCSTCIALPGCMGGCAHHGFHSADREAKCGTFRHNHVERVTETMRRSMGLDPGDPAPLPRLDQGRGAPEPVATPVTIGRRPASVGS